MPLVILGANSVSGGYEIDNSLRFNSGSSDELTRTFPTDGNRKTFTFSCWHKRTVIGGASGQSLFFGDTAGTTNATQDSFYFGGSGNNQFIFGGWLSGIFTSNMLFRDVSAWYHIIVAVDTTQATSANRVRFYVNGVEQSYTSGAGYPAQNADFGITKSGNHSWFGNDGQSGRGNGYLAEAYLIDGQQLTPSSFGETDQDTNIWKPIPYTGSFGTNGFYLQFKNSASLGTDSSGNGNTFTVNNLTSIDQTTDTPTNNFSTLNSLDKHASLTPTEGNLAVSNGGGTWMPIKSTFAVSKGKWYCEAKITSGADFPIAIYLSRLDGSSQSNMDSQRIYYNIDYSGGSIIATGVFTYEENSVGTSTTNDIIGMALDCDNGTMKFYKNGSQLGSTVTNSAISSNEWMFGVQLNGDGVQFNFGNPMYSANSYTDGAGYGNFSYAVPSGYYALNTKNLADYG